MGERLWCADVGGVFVWSVVSKGNPNQPSRVKGKQSRGCCVELSPEQRSRQRPMAMSRQPGELSVLLLVCGLLLW
jgi:hypothetical protein